MKRCLCSTLLLTLLLSNAAWADNHMDYQIWLTSGFWSHHFQRDKGFKENNTGIGMEFTVNPEANLNFGSYKNSDYQRSHYVGLTWQPYQLGIAKFGLWAGALDGYPNMKEGDWFLAAFPMMSLQYQAVGLNLTVMPTYKNRIHGAVVAQVKVKIWE